MKNNSTILYPGNTTSVPETTTGKPFIGTGEFSHGVEALLISLCCIICIFALVFNGVICYIFYKRKVRSTTFNHLLLLLSLTDMASVLFVTPYLFIKVTDLTEFSQNTLNVFCGIIIGNSSYWLCTFVSISILSLISVNRYFLINHPSRALWLRKKKTVWIFFAGFWFVSFCITTPNVFAFRYEKVTGLCYRQWPPGFSRIAYSVCTTMIGMAIPLLCMTHTFIGTVITLKRSSSLERTESAVLRARKRVITLLGTLIIAFVLCSIPPVVYWILSAATNYFPGGVEGEYIRLKWIKVVIIFPLSNTLMDPIIYAFRSEEFKQALLEIITPRIQSTVSTLSLRSPSSNQDITVSSGQRNSYI